MKRLYILFKRCKKTIGINFVIVFILNLGFFGMNWVLISATPSLILRELLEGKSIIKISSILGMLFISGVLYKYCSSLQDKYLFCFRLNEIVSVQKTSLNVPISELEFGTGKQEIENAMCAVTSGNAYGVEAYLSASCSVIMLFFTGLLYLISFNNMPYWFLGLIAMELLLVLPYEIKFQHKEEEDIKQNIVDRNELEKFRRIILQDNYAKDSRIFNGQKYTEAELNSRTLPLFNFTNNRKKNRLKRSWYVSSIILLKNLFFIGMVIASSNKLSVESITLFIGVMSSIDILAEQFIIKICEISNNKQSVIDFIDFMCKYGEISESISGKQYASSSQINELKFENVSFSYDNKRILDNISFQINRGEKVAVIGENGVGKTTLIKLLLGVLSPDKGNIQINKINLSQLDKSEYWNRISVALQDSPIFSFTIGENVSCEPIDCMDRERVWEAINSAELVDTIKRLKHKEMSYFSNEYSNIGTDLSGGERQKLFMARMLYKNADLLVLDEPTAALDPKAELSIYKMYEKFTDDKICLFVSHRLSTTSFCDKILFIDGPGCVYLSTFQKLYSSNEKFRELYDTQEHYYRETSYEKSILN